MANTIPNESTAEMLTYQALSELPALPAFLEGLTVNEQRRFMEFAHHLTHTAFMSGLERSTPGEVPVEASWFLRGYNEAVKDIEGDI